MTEQFSDAQVEDIARIIARNNYERLFPRPTRHDIAYRVDGQWPSFIPVATEVIAAASALAWRGIESAPRDGTKLLIYFDTEQTEICSWFEGGWYNGELLYKGDDDPIPAHWQPLPAPPQARP